MFNDMYIATKGSYVHNSMVECSEESQKCQFYAVFSEKLMVSDKKIHRAFRTRTNLYTKPIREFFHFHHLPKLYICFNFYE